uniref:Uncharacterized protein n=1 Tax=Aegilops tauschii subsp. strangulata TaxID=200361 RepID=A0A453BFK9_AEGTS
MRVSPPPPPSQRLPRAPHPHLLSGSRGRLTPTYSAAPAGASPPTFSAAPAGASPPPSPRLLPAPGSPRDGRLPSPTGHLPLQAVQASPLRLLLAALGDAPAATPPRPWWEVRHRSIQRSKPTARGRSPSQHPFPAAIVRCSVQLLQPTQAVAPFATTAPAQTRAWSSSTSSSRGLRASPARVCLHQKYNSCYSPCTCTCLFSKQ